MVSTNCSLVPFSGGISRQTACQSPPCLPFHHDRPGRRDSNPQSVRDWTALQPTDPSSCSYQLPPYSQCWIPEPSPTFSSKDFYSIRGRRTRTSIGLPRRGAYLGGLRSYQPSRSRLTYFRTSLHDTSLLTGTFTTYCRSRTH